MEEHKSDYSSVFDENGVNTSERACFFTRTQYLKEYNSILEAYEKEKHEQIKSIVISVACCIAVFIIAELGEKFMYAHPMNLNVVIYGILFSFKVVAPIITVLIIAGLVKKLFNLNKHRDFALKKLENIKNEQIINSTYDAEA